MAIVANMAIVTFLAGVVCMASVNLARPTQFAALALLAVLSGTLSAQAGTAIHFTLDRKIDGTAAPFFLAIDKGYFSDEGLDVTIDNTAGGPPEVFNRLAAAKADMAVSDLNLLIKFRDTTGTPIKAVFIVFDKPPYAIIGRKSRGVAVPVDLQGKKLGAPAADPTFAQWPIFAKVAGIDAAKVAVEDVGLPVCQPMLAAGEIDAVTGFSFTVYVDLKARDVPADDLAVLPMADYGLELYGDAIMVAPAFAQQKPDAVRAFLRAYVRALKDTVRDPAGAIEALLRHSEGLSKDVESERLRMALRDNIVTPAVKANGFGGIEPERFAAAIEQIALAYRFKAKDKAAAAFDASFLSPAAER
jgi:NitT/TauT family transport system substrate-binding protein